MTPTAGDIVTALKAGVAQADPHVAGELWYDTIGLVLMVSAG